MKYKQLQIHLGLQWKQINLLAYLQNSKKTKKQKTTTPPQKQTNKKT